MGGHPSVRQRAERKAPNPHAHRVAKMPPHYNRMPAGELGRDPMAQAVVLPWVPTACPKCNNGCLRDRGLEVGCAVCGWEQMVRR